MAHDLFISHSSRDKKIANELCRILESEGVKCWIAPRNIQPGQEWPVAIVNAVSSSRAMVLVFSDNANHSRDVAKETLLAINSDINIYPVKIDNSSPSGVMQYYLAGKEWFDASEHSLEGKVRELLDKVRPMIKEKQVQVRDAGTVDRQKSNLKQPASMRPAEKAKSLLNRYRKLMIPVGGLFALVTFSLIYYLSALSGIPALDHQAEQSRKVYAGNLYSFVLLESGELYAFGQGFNGRLGLGSNHNILVPAPLVGVVGVTSIAAGDAHTLFLMDNGEVYAAGYNRYGQLGTGNYDSQLEPIPIENISGAVAIAAGNNHSLILLDNGDLYSFGLGISDQLGNDRIRILNVPEKIENLPEIIAIAAGEAFSIALTTAGEIYSFGDNTFGQLGHEDITQTSVPTKIEGLADVKAIAAGSYHTLALTQNGEVYSFGLGREGQLGHDIKESMRRPRRISGLPDLAAIAAGREHSLLLSHDGKVYTFGSGTNGVLGHGNSDEKLVPTAIEGIPAITAIAAGWQHSLLVDKEGRIYSFGRNRFGQLGIDDIIGTDKPEIIAYFDKEEE